MNLNFKYSAMALLMMAGTSSAVMAAVTADLKVTGKIGAPTCKITLSNSAGIDYSRIGLSTLNESTDTVLAVKSMPVSVTCDADTSITVAFKDNRVSSAGGNTLLLENVGVMASFIEAYGGAGLGFDSAGNKIGGYNSSASNPKIDGKVTLWTKKGTGSWLAETGSEVEVVSTLRMGNPETKYGFTNDQAGKVFTFDYNVQANIAPKSSLDTSVPITLDGSVAMQVDYL